MLKADIDFPEYCGSPLLTERSAKRGLTFNRDKSNNGLAYQQKGFLFQPKEMTFSLIVNSAQGIILESFYYSKGGLNQGLNWFNIKRLMPEGLAYLPCRFTTPLNCVAMGNKHWKYTAKIEVLDAYIYNDQESAWVIGNFDRIDYILNVVMYG